MTAQEYAEIYRNNSMGEGVTVGDLESVPTPNPAEEIWGFAVTDDRGTIHVEVRAYTFEVASTPEIAAIQTEGVEEGHVG